jgi:CRP-like cAMP-binding protein
MFEIFGAYLKEKAGLIDEELQAVQDLTTSRKIRKRQFLLHEGQVSHYNGFVAKGCLRLYRIGKDGTEHILRFAIENWWMADYESYNTGQPAKGNIDAIEDSEVVLIKKQDLDDLCQSIPRLGQFKEQLDARSYDASQNRILSNISETAEEKYENFLKNSPHLSNRVPLHMVASFLGVSRETLSRIRHQFTREQKNSSKH